MPLCVHRQVDIHFLGIQVINFNPIKKKFIDGLYIGKELDMVRKEGKEGKTKDFVGEFQIT